MPQRLTSVAKLSLVEKLAIDLIRGSGSLAADSGAFKRLTDDAKRAEMKISALDCPFLTRDEINLLGCIALMQRQRADLTIDLPREMLVSIEACAKIISRQGLTLEYRNVSRMTRDAPVHVVFSAQNSVWQNRSAARPFRPTVLQQIVLRYVIQHKRVRTAELHRLGASRTIIDLMCKRGFIARIGFGLYALGPIATNIDTSGS